MWYEILPSFAIMTAGITMTAVVSIGYKYFYNGTIQGRARNSKILRHYWNRDERITGLAANIKAGLDGLPAM